MDLQTQMKAEVARVAAQQVESGMILGLGSGSTAAILIEELGKRWQSGDLTEIKGVPTPIGGQADVLVLPTLEACNAFYKGLMLFGGGELGGLIQGTSRPVVVMSRSESPRSKLYCIALACLMV